MFFAAWRGAGDGAGAGGSDFDPTSQPALEGEGAGVGAGRGAARRAAARRRISWAARFAIEDLERRIMRSAVVGRFAFYNNSSFDGANSALNVQDDDAIASDMSALLPGNRATF